MKQIFDAMSARERPKRITARNETFLAKIPSPPKSGSANGGTPQRCAWNRNSLSAEDKMFLIQTLTERNCPGGVGTVCFPVHVLGVMCLCCPVVECRGFCLRWRTSFLALLFSCSIRKQQLKVGSLRSKKEYLHHF